MKDKSPATAGFFYLNEKQCESPIIEKKAKYAK